MDPSRRSPVARVFSDERGDLRTARLLALGLAVIVLLFVGMFAGLLAADMGSPGTLAIWLVGALLLIKLPFLAVMWWVIARRRDPTGGGGWSAGECREILDYLETQAAAAAGRPDAAARLAYFSREAWFVADRAEDADKGDAVEAAMRIESLAVRAGAAAGRPGAPGV